jgi:PAS domain S-box-containing protein
MDYYNGYWRKQMSALTKTPLEKENAALKRRIAKLEKQLASHARAEDAASGAQANLNALIENTDARIWAVDSQYRLLIGNSFFMRQVRDALGREIKIGESVFQEAFPPQVNAEWKGYYDRALLGEAFRVETITRLRATPRYVEYLFHPIKDAEGQINGVTVFERDITERKQAEEKLRESERFFRFIATHSPDTIFFQDRELRYEWLINPISALPPEEYIGKTDLELFPSDQSIALAELKQQILQTGEGQRIEVQLDVDGSHYWHDAVYQSIRGEDGSVMGIAGYIRDITERKRIQQELKNSHEQLRELSRQLLETQEKERRAIGRELHDEIGQTLTGLKILMEMAQRLPADECHEKIQQAQQAAGELIDRVSALSLDLRPPMLDDLGLLSTLLWFANRYTTQTNIRVDFYHEGLQDKRFDPAIETAVYRLAQEALTNVARHAGADRVSVRVIAKGGMMELFIEDAGVGFDSNTAYDASGGFSGMRERVHLLEGSLEIESAPGRGVRTSIRLPLITGGGEEG